MKLFHWHADMGGFKADYLVATESLESARRIILDQIAIPGGIEAQSAGHDGYVREQDPFVADVDYPIVIF